VKWLQTLREESTFQGEYARALAFKKVCDRLGALHLANHQVTAFPKFLKSSQIDPSLNYQGITV
jgi:hypothetical protein